jgi:GntR family transcriptional regulator
VFRLDPTGGIPIYQQLVEAVKQATATGRLREGDQLPTIRELALQLRVNPNTVSHAYQELEREGVVETRRGAGTFVASRPPRLAEAERRRLVTLQLDRALAEAYHLGISFEQVEALLRERMERFLDATPAGERFAPPAAALPHPPGALATEGGLSEPRERKEA